MRENILRYGVSKVKNKNSDNKTSLIFTRETLGMTVLLFCFIVTLALFSGSAIFAGFGKAICTFMYGTFGYGCFLVMAALAYLGVWLVAEKKLKLKFVPVLLGALTVYALFLLFHSVSTRTFELDGGYISDCYNAAGEGFPHYTFGGVLSAIIVYPVARLTTFVGAYIIFAALSCLAGAYAVKSFIKNYKKGGASAKTQVSVQTHARAIAGDAAAATTAETPSAPAYDNGYDMNGAYAQNGGYAQGGAYAQPESFPQGGATAPATADGYQQNFADPYAAQQYQGQDYVQPVQPQYAQPQYDNSAYQQEKHFVEPYFTTQHMRGGSAEREEDKFSPEKLGRKILLNRDEFAAESYRRNGIFDENSYFNHPIKNTGDYMRGFSDGKAKKATTVEPATYSEAYRSSVDSEPSAPVNGMLYGDAPAQKLSDEGAVQDVSADSTTAYTAPETAAEPFVQEGPIVPDEDDVDFGAPETDIDDSAELFSSDTPERGAESMPSASSEQPAVDSDRSFPSSRFDSRRLDETLFPSAESDDSDSVFPSSDRGDSLRYGTDRGDLSRGRDSFAARGEESRESSFTSPLQSENSQLSRGTDFSRRDSSLNLSSRQTPSEEVRSDDSRADDFSENNADDAADSDLSSIAPEQTENRRLAGFGGSEERFRGARDESSSEGADNGISSLFSSTNSRLGESRVEPDISRLSSRRESRAGIFDGDDGPDVSQPPIFGTRRDAPAAETPSGADSGSSFVTRQPVRQAESAPVAEEKPAEEQKPPHIWKKYVRPSLDLLEDYPEQTANDAAEVEESKRVIIETLESFKIECEISDVVVGPAITRFDVIIKDRTNIKSSLKYKESIAMTLKKENVNAYLNYTKGALSIEVPNSHRSVVGLKGMMLSQSFKNAKVNSLTFALGKNVEGACICPDITKMPHLLVAGTTGSGKSICLSSLLISLLYKYGPEELRFILVDPKQVEFISYDKLPHLMINEIIYDVDKAIKALNWAIKEMERRYTLFKDMTETGANAKGHVKTATKDLNEYNAHLEDGLEKLPKIVIVLDEFGDLMLQAKKDIESRIIKLVQKARAAGIHLILATQRPSVDCITGLIKSNLPTRIGFKVGSFDDSRTIFDVGGAEKLLGKGDMYFRSAERPDLMRIQGCFVDTPEVQRVTDFIKEHNETYFDQSVSDFINKVEEPEQSGSLSDGGDAPEETKIDDTFIRALKYCVMQNAASVSMIQRRFPIGYIKACKIVDWMENMNYITKSEGSKSRKVLLSQEEFFNTYGDVDD